MIPVDQNRFNERGNCLEACVASILEVPLEVVEIPYEGDWWDHFTRWAQVKGYKPLYRLRSPELDEWLLAYGDFYIPGGRSPRLPNLLHAVVGHKGRVVHDPHPSRIGLAKIEDYILLPTLEQADIWGQ